MRLLQGDNDACPLFRGLAGSPPGDLFEKLFANPAAYDPAVSTVIDNSKKPPWARRFSVMPCFRMKYIHLTRDPRALVRRWMLTCEMPEAGRKIRLRTARRAALCHKHIRAYLDCIGLHLEEQSGLTAADTSSLP